MLVTDGLCVKIDIDGRNGGARRRSHEKEKQLEFNVFDEHVMRLDKPTE
jgi:hypothetical protein